MSTYEGSENGQAKEHVECVVVCWIIKSDTDGGEGVVSSSALGKLVIGWKRKLTVTCIFNLPNISVGKSTNVDYKYAYEETGKCCWICDGIPSIPIIGVQRRNFHRQIKKYCRCFCNEQAGCSLCFPGLCAHGNNSSTALFASVYVTRFSCV